MQTTRSLPPFDPHDPALLENPYPQLRRYRELEPLHWGRSVTPVVEGQWWIFRHADVSALLVDPRFGSDAPRMRKLVGVPRAPEAVRPLLKMVDRWMIQHDGEEHRRLRELANRAFTPRRVSRLRPRIEEVCDDLLSALSPGREFELVRSVALPFSARVIAELLGVPTEGLERFGGWLGRLPAVLGGSRDPKHVMAAARAMVEMQEFFSELLAVRRADPEEDLLSAMAQAEYEGDRFSDDEVIATAILLLGAGHITTVHLIANAVHELLEQPQVLAALRAEPGRTEPAVDELVRVAGPAERAVRYCFESAEVGGCRIERGQLVGLLLSSANRDPELFPDPDRIDLDRDARAHLGFGRGPHFCLGASLARLEAGVALRAIIERFPALQHGSEPPRWRQLFGRGLGALSLQT